MSAPNSFLSNQALAALNEVAILLPVFLLIFTCRGFFQALIAKLMGDKTPEQDGFISLNPLVHIDFIGILVILGCFFVISGFFSSAVPRTVLLIILIMTGIRWTIPVRIDDRKFTNYRLGGILTSLAGALGNFLLAFVGMGVLKLVSTLALASYVKISIVTILTTLIQITVFFGVIDLIPLPPFNGGKILRYALPSKLQWLVQNIEKHALIIILVLFFAPFISTLFFGGIFKAAFVIRKLMASIFF